MTSLEARVVALETAVRLLLKRDVTRTLLEEERGAVRTAALATPEDGEAAFDVQVWLCLGQLLA